MAQKQKVALWRLMSFCERTNKMTNPTEPAGHVPAFLTDDIKWQELDFSNKRQSVTVNVPVLTVKQCKELSDHVKPVSYTHLRAHET